MAADVTVTPSDVKTGDALSFAATGFDTTTTITIDVVGPDNGFSVHAEGETDGSGDFMWTDLVRPNRAGIVSWSVSDGTDTLADSIQVWQHA